MNLIHFFTLTTVLICLRIFSSPSKAEADLPWPALLVLDYNAGGNAFKQALQKSAPGTDAHDQATLGLAVSLHQRLPDVQRDKEKAAELYESLIESGNSDTIRATALLMRGRLDQMVDYHGDSPEPDQAIANYNQLLAMEDVPYPLPDLAALYRAQTRIDSMQPEQAATAVKELTSWIQSRGVNAMTSTGWLLVSLAYQNPLNKPEEALHAMENARAAELPPDTKMDLFYWKMANFAEEAQRIPDAIRYYALLITDVKRSGYAYAAKMRILDLGGTPPPLHDPYAEADESTPVLGEAN